MKRERRALRRASWAGLAAALVAAVAAGASGPAVGLGIESPPPSPLAAPAATPDDAALGGVGGLTERISAGDQLSCAVADGTTVTCWGRNLSGAAEPPTGAFAQVAAGQTHACGLRSDGRVACWGSPGPGGYSPVGEFTQVAVSGRSSCAVTIDRAIECWGNQGVGQSEPPAGSYVEVSVGDLHACAVGDDGAVACWGADTDGRASPPGGEFTQVSAGRRHSCGLRSDGSVACWGDDLWGQSSPPGGAFAEVSAGGTHSCGLRIDGTVDCWGSMPGAMPQGSFSQVSAGSAHTCAVRADGRVWCWGQDLYGEATPPDGLFRSIEAFSSSVCAVRTDRTAGCWGVLIEQPPPGEVEQVEIGWNHGCGRRSIGGVVCWGNDVDGSTVPPAADLSQISAGGDHTCGIDPGGAAVCWGVDSDGQASPPAGPFTQVSAGSRHSCALRVTGSVACWGADASGQSAPPGGSFTGVSAGADHSCAVRVDGSVACWGADVTGESSPPSGSFAAVSAGDGGSCGLRTDGSAVCWGGEQAQVPPVEEYTEVVTGHEFACGLTTVGVTHCWGAMSRRGAAALLVTWPEGPVPVPPLRVWPDRLAASPDVTLRVIGGDLEEDTAVALHRDGVRIEAGSTVPEVGWLDARFDLTSAAPGTWDVVVASPDGPEETLAEAVTVEPDGGWDVRVRVGSRGAFRPGVPTTIALSVWNRGSADAIGQPVYLGGLPEGTRIEGGIETEPGPWAGLFDVRPEDEATVLEASAAPQLVETDQRGWVLPLVVSRVPAHQVVEVRVRLTMDTTEPSVALQGWASTCIGDPAWSPTPGARSARPEPRTGRAGSRAGCAIAIGELAIDAFATALGTVAPPVPGAACVQAAMGVVTAATFESARGDAGIETNWFGAMFAPVALGVISCVVDVIPGGALIRFAKAIVEVSVTATTGLTSTLSALEACDEQSPTDEVELERVESFDPNAKVGPGGVGEAGYTTPDVPVSYTVFFENLAEATAPAQVVTITDPIDTEAFDPATIQLGPVVVAGEVVATPPPGTREWSTVVPLDGMDELLGVEVGWDDATGQLTWVLTTLDPVTGELTEDPFGGFLPPNLEPPEGEGSVSFSVEPRDRSDGVVLSNDASIVFDANEPIATETWTNTLDGTPPVGTIDDLPATSPPQFDVSWTLEDATSGLGGFSIWISTDGGPGEVWFSSHDPTETSKEFTGSPGSTYSFWVEAWDRAGNAQVADGPQATTTVEAQDASTTVTLTASPPAPAWDEDLTLTASVAPASATGTVQFSVDGDLLGSPVALAEGVATSAPVAGLRSGDHDIAAAYSGDEGHLPSAAESTVHIARRPSTTTVHPTFSVVGAGDDVCIDIVVDPPLPEGDVSVSSGTRSLDVGLDAGEAMACLSDVPEGEHVLTASFVGDQEVAPSGGSATVAVLPPDEAFVARAYLSVLGRSGSAGEVRYWTGRLEAGVTHLRVAQTIAASAEGRGRIVDHAYMLVLGRSPERSGRTYWSERLGAGLSPERLLVTLLGSPEVAGRAGGPSGLVEILFAVYLGRDATAADVTYWAGRLDAAASPTGRATVALRFGRTAEARAVAVRRGALAVCATGEGHAGLLSHFDASPHHTPLIQAAALALLCRPGASG